MPEALEAEKRRETKLGQLIANREFPVLLRARELMNKERVELLKESKNGI